MLFPAQFIPKHRIIIDTCSLMDPVGREYVATGLWPLLKQSSRRLVIPERVWAELQRLSTSGDGDRERLAQAAKTLVERLRADGCAEVFGDPGDPFADAVIASVVTRYRTKLDMLVITQDRALAQLLLGIRNADAINSRFDLTIARIRTSGLEQWQVSGTAWTKSHGPASSNHAPRPKPQPKPKPAAFVLPAQIVAGTPQPIRVSTIPGEGQIVATETGIAFTLGRALANGGEGTIHELGGGKVAKIYKAERLTDRTLAKLKIMTAKPVSVRGVCWPEDVLYNSRREPVGYLMPKAEGISLDTSVFKKPLLQKKLPEWKRVDLVRVAIRVAEIVGELHSRNVIMGDINQGNILVKPDGTVTFVDLDSAQIDGYPCPVGMINFTRPERHGRDYSTYLRDFDDDRFALAVMLFMILVPGKPPYSHAGGGDPGENIRKRHFPYHFGQRGSDGVPDGPWRFIWSHFSHKVKEAFHRAFAEGVLMEPAEWMKVLKTYESAITRGKMDPEQGNEIFPTRIKRLSAEVQSLFNIQQEEMVEFSCRTCSKTFEMARSRVDRLNFTPDRCPDCKKAARLQRDASSADMTSSGPTKPVLRPTAGALRQPIGAQSRPRPYVSPSRSAPPRLGPTSISPPSRNTPGEGLLIKLLRKIFE